MRYVRNGFYLGMLLLTLLTACGGATPAITPTPTPTALRNSRLPSFSNAGATGVIPPKALACSPPVPSISNINSFCANPGADLGGATWVQHPSESDPSVAEDAAFINNFSENPDCTWAKTKVACSGPENAKLNYDVCTFCGAPMSPDSVKPKAYEATYGPNVCSDGYVKAKDGYCVPADPKRPYYGLCPSGSHYDNVLQNCADDVTDKLAAPCPPGDPYYLPVIRLCLAKAYSIVYNCQDFTVPLGECLPIRNPNICQPVLIGNAIVCK
jgi:hypothetical protein